MSAIPSDVPWWVTKEPNFARLQAAICRRDVIFGLDEVLRVEQKPDEKPDDQSESSISSSK